MYTSIKNLSICSFLMGVWTPLQSAFSLMAPFVSTCPCFGVLGAQRSGSYTWKQACSGNAWPPVPLQWKSIPLCSSFWNSVGVRGFLVEGDACLFFVCEWGPGWSHCFSIWNSLGTPKHQTWWVLSVFSRWWRGGWSLTGMVCRRDLFCWGQNRTVSKSDTGVYKTAS